MKTINNLLQFFRSIMLIFSLSAIIALNTDASEWVKVMDTGHHFSFPNPEVKVPVGYNDMVIVYKLKYLIPDRVNYNPIQTYDFLDNLDLHRVSLIRLFMENPILVTTSSIDKTPFYWNPFWMEDRPGSFEDPSFWSLDENPGMLRIVTQKGDTWEQENDAVNLLLRAIDPPEMQNFSVTTKVHFVPEGNFDCASVFVYQDKDNYVRLSRHPDGIEYFREIEGVVDNYKTLPFSEDVVYLRIKKRRFLLHWRV